MKAETDGDDVVGRPQSCNALAVVMLGRLKMQDVKMTVQVAGHKNDGPSKPQGVKRHEKARHENAGHENAGHEIAGRENARHENTGRENTGREMQDMKIEGMKRICSAFTGC